MKDDNDIAYRNATQLIDMLSNREITSLGLLEQSIARIEELDNEINAVVVRDFDNARSAAKKADAAIAKGKYLPLLGLPITVKESFRVTGLPTTWGSPQFKNWIPDHDSVAVSLLKKAGAIIIGKTNVPFMLKDWQAYNDIYGVTNNPYNMNLSPGGSSGGSAAALAAGFTSLELGSDMGGSLRVPANFCGVYAHKSSHGLVSMRGAAPPMVPPAPFQPSLVVAGPMARSPIDLKLGLDIIAGPDQLSDGKAYSLNLPKQKKSKLNEYRVLIIDEHPLCPISSEVSRTFNNVIDKLKTLCASITFYQNSMPDLAETTYNYLTLFGAKSAADIPTETYEAMKKHIQKLPPHEKGFSNMLMHGITMSHREWFIAERKRMTYCQQWRQLFNSYDVILSPVTPTSAFQHDHSDFIQRTITVDGNALPFNQAFAWIAVATLFGFPATAAPIGQTISGAPIGIQIVGDYLDDYTTIEFARLLGEKCRGFVNPNL